jgi:YVTN family beta-propeller protein
MWVANSGSNNVTKIRTRTGVVEGSPIAVGNSPQALAFDGTFLYVANNGSDSVTRIRVSSGAVEGSPIEVGDGPFSLVFAGGSIYVAHPVSEDGTDGYLKKIRVSTGTVEGTINHLWGALAFDGTFVYVAMNGAIQRIRASTGVLESYGIDTAQSGMNVTGSGFAICFDGASIFVTGHVNTGPGAPERLVIRTNVNGLGIEGGPVPVLGEVKALAFDGTYVYAANELSFTDPQTGVFSWVNGNVIRFQ